jgi:hypothetical protein
MAKQVKRLIIGLVAILVCLTGLLAVSALVPEVGCQRQEDRNPSFIKTPTDIYISVPEQVNTGQAFSINGTLERHTIPFPDKFPQQIIRIKSDFFRKTVITDSLGQFILQIVTQKPGYFSIEASYGGDQQGFYAPSSTGQTLEVIGEVPGSKSTGTSNLRFYLICIFIVVAIGLYLIDRHFKLLNLRTSTNKVFRICLLAGTILLIAGVMFMAFKPTNSSVDWNSGAYHTGSANFTKPKPAEMHIGSSTILTKTLLKIPEKVEPGNSLEFHGTSWQLLSKDELPLSQKNIDIFISPISNIENDYTLPKKVASIITDSEGNFYGKIDFNQAGDYEVSAVFNDTGSTYISSNDVKVVKVGDIVESPFDDLKSPGWLSIIFGVPILLLVLLTGLVFLRHRQKEDEEDTGENKEKVKIFSKPPPTPIPGHTKAPPINIDFPQIASALPVVWGKDESLLIMFTVEGSKQILGNYSLDIEFGGDDTVRSSINQEGKASQEHVFRKKGQYQIQAVLVKDVRNGYLPASRIVKIVDYREEIVRLYNEMVGSVKVQGLTLSPKMTVREVEYRLRKAYPDLSGEVTNSLISVFEEANYSLHPISRPEYEKMYRAVGEVEEQIMRK